ncbi:MAG TPA: 23S rRNA (guanosine(2251)-2'-O)-methyltransferase RlmB [Gammaproteobacteria bacterium]|nr:23S rRNA (guanosine(2251)-2'-O)-methyltransferase RlmB [Gammaproteobacteria bacterium]
MPKTQLIFGIHAVQSALRNDPANVQELRMDRTRHDARLRQLRVLAAHLGIRLVDVEPTVLRRQAPGRRHQGVIALYQATPAMDQSELMTLVEQVKQPLLLLLDGITDPHNLGACLRTAEAAGVHAVIAPRNRAVGINATVRKVASGAAERVPFVQVTNLARGIRMLKQKGLLLIGATSDASESLYDLDLTRPLVLLMGAEGTGLRRLTRELCDVLAYIPMAGAAQSLNVSVATGVCLFEIVRQRGAPDAD